MAAAGGDEELMSKTVSTERKRIMLHLKGNKFGHFIKIAEYGHVHQAKIVIPYSGASEFADAVDEVAVAAERMGASAPAEGGENLFSKVVRIEAKRYFLDLRGNKSGQ